MRSAAANSATPLNFFSKDRIAYCCTQLNYKSVVRALFRFAVRCVFRDCTRPQLASCRNRIGDSIKGRDAILPSWCNLLRQIGSVSALRHIAASLMEGSGNHAGKGNQAMFKAKETTVLMTAATAMLFTSIAIIAVGDLLLGGTMMLVGAYTAILATLPGGRDD